MATISWGKPKIFIGAAGAAPLTTASTSGAYAFSLLSTPVEDSTNLTGTQGDKTEATIEGGEAEATKYNAATFELTMNVRMALDTVGNNEVYRYLAPALYKATTGNDAYKEYTKSNVAVVLIPDEEKAPGFFCPACSVNIMETYTAADGAMWEITLAPNVTANDKAVNFGQFYAVKKTAGGVDTYQIVTGTRPNS